jgi:hypothetical protein
MVIAAAAEPAPEGDRGRISHNFELSATMHAPDRVHSGVHPLRLPRTTRPPPTLAESDSLTSNASIRLG